jgi:hypothetical protein
MGIKLVSKPEGESILFCKFSRIVDGTVRLIKNLISIDAENDVDQVNIDKDGSAFFQTNTLWNKANSVFP